jgi:hypothetical protein
MLSRRKFAIGLSASTALGADSALPQHAPDGRIAIIDTPENAARRLQQLKEQKIAIVGRYYARALQPGLDEKVMSSDANKVQGVLEPTFLIRNGLSVVSVYQYLSSDPDKFLKGLPDTRSRQAEARADATAALDQARKVSQPEATAIYFGLDFNLTKSKSDLIDACLEYFRTVKNIVGNHYALGVYGNGFANRLLRKEGLVAYSWVSASRSYEETAQFVSDGQWHLFQNQIDRRWFESAGPCPSGMDIDTNVQNPHVPNIGSWGAATVGQARTDAIFAQRRFALRDTTAYTAKSTESAIINKKRCVYKDHAWVTIAENAILRCNNARVLSDDGVWLQVDIDDDGVADGYCLRSDMTADLKTMPHW